MATDTKSARSIHVTFEMIKARGGHAAIDFRNGELVLSCTRPSDDKATWGKGATPYPPSQDWCRLVEC